MAAATFWAVVLRVHQFIAQEADLLVAFLSKSSLPLLYVHETTLERISMKLGMSSFIKTLLNSRVFVKITRQITGGVRVFLALLTGITC
jgi:hypothetical protein